MHRSFKVLALSFMMVVLASDCRAEEASFAVVGYLPGYRVNDVTPAQLRGVTHLIYFGLVPSEDGRLASPPIAKAVLAKLHEIKIENKCDLLLSVGGWNRSAAFPALARDASARKRFVTAETNEALKRRFGGVMIWELGQDSTDKSTSLLQAIRDCLRESARSASDPPPE